jgi:hypothetical protein
MTTDPRLFAAELAETLYGLESRAWTCYHPGQLTVSDYRRLDRFEPWEMTAPLARVKTGLLRGAFEYLGLDADGWLCRTDLVTSQLRDRRCARLFALPYLRLVDENTGFALPEHTRVDSPSERSQ